MNKSLEEEKLLLAPPPLCSSIMFCFLFFPVLMFFLRIPFYVYRYCFVGCLILADRVSKTDRVHSLVC